MKVCALTINDKTVTVDELKELIASGNSKAIEELTGKSINELEVFRRLLVRFDISSKVDSAMEMQSKRKAKKENVELADNPSQRDVNYWVYPRKQYHDYTTQKEIHRNTYTGIRLTGISANSGKALGYQFEATPIVSIRDINTGVTYKGKSKSTLLNTLNIDTDAELLFKFPNFEVVEREEPLLKEEVTFKIGNVLFDRLRRNELDERGLPYKQPHSGNLISIFETIDTIINLAIDNVKEQKLFTLGITNANANAYFSILSTGVPLNTVVKIFTDPTIESLSLLSRIYPENITSAMEEYVSTFNELIDTKDFGAFSSFMSENEIQILGFQQPDEALKYFVNNASINSEILDSIYLGEASKGERALSTILLLSLLKKGMRIGEEMFAAAQTYSLLRSMPSNASAIEYKTSLPTKYSAFNFSVEADDIDKEAYIRKAVEYIKENDKVYLELPDSRKDLYIEDFLKVLNNPASKRLIKMEINEELEAKFRNSMMYGSLRKAIQASDNSVFQNVAPLSIPHVYSAWKTLNFLKNLLEKTFAMHNPTMKAFIEKLMDEADLFTSYNKYELMESMITEFFRFISANMQLEVGGDTLDLNVRNASYTIGDVTYQGSEAWSQEFITRLKQAKSLDRTANRFLENIEFSENKNKTWNVSIYSDKIHDFKIREAIRQDFRLLYLNPATKQLALDMFKHSIITEGLLYKRSAFSLIFPPSFITAYSDQFVQVLNNFFSTNRTLMMSRLESVSNLFLRQYLRNFPDSAQYNARYKPKPGKAIKEGSYSKGTYSGIAVDGDNRFYYDLYFEGLDPKTARKIIKTYGEEVYYKIETPNTTQGTYYRQITEVTPHTHYDFDLANDLRNEFDITALGRNELIVPTTYIKSGNLNDPNTHNRYLVGDIIYTFNRRSPRIERLVAYKVTKDNHPSYTLQRQPASDIQVFKPTSNVFAKYPVLIGNTNTSVIYSASSKIRTIGRALSNPSGFAIVRGATQSNERIASIPDTVDDTNVTKLELQLSALDPVKNVYFVQSNLLEGIDESNRTILATALYNAIGYVDPILKDVKEAVGAIDEAIKLATSAKTRPYFSVGVGPSAHVDVSLLSQFEEKGFVDVPYNSLPEFDALRQGDIIYLGKRGTLPLFGYVQGITTLDNTPTSFQMFIIPTNVATKLDRDNYSIEEFEMILLDNLDQNNC